MERWRMEHCGCGWTEHLPMEDNLSLEKLLEDIPNIHKGHKIAFDNIEDSL